MDNRPCSPDTVLKALLTSREIMTWWPPPVVSCSCLIRCTTASRPFLTMQLSWNRANSFWIYLEYFVMEAAVTSLRPVDPMTPSGLIFSGVLLPKKFRKRGAKELLKSGLNFKNYKVITERKQTNNQTVHVIK